MAKIFLTHTSDMLANYYGPRALAELRQLGDIRLNETDRVLDAEALAQAARGCEIVVSDRQTPGPAGFSLGLASIADRDLLSPNSIELVPARACALASPANERCFGASLPGAGRE